MTVARVKGSSTKIKRPLIDTGTCIVVPLTRQQFAIVDREDHHLVDGWNWTAFIGGRSFYAARREGGKLVSMAREILMVKINEQADHINHDTLDNRRANLRASTASQNQHNKMAMKNNTSGYKGVYLEWDGKWRATIAVNRKRFRLGRFTCPVKAAKAYDEAARELHGEFACLNFPEES